MTEPDDLPEFVPVPLIRARHDGWSAARQRAFIAHLAESGIVASAAKAVGMGVTSAYALRARAGAESFVEAWDIVLDAARGRALAMVQHQAIHGTTTPRFYRGRFAGTITRHETRLALAALRALDAMVARKVE